MGLAGSLENMKSNVLGRDEIERERERERGKERREKKRVCVCVCGAGRRGKTKFGK